MRYIPLKTAAVIALTALAACEPYPEMPACQPIADAQGQIVVGCTADGEPILMSPQPQRPAPAPAPARTPTPVRSGPIGGTVASGEFGPVPTVVEATGEPLPPPPATLEPVEPGQSGSSRANTGSGSTGSSSGRSGSGSSGSNSGRSSSAPTRVTPNPATVTPPSDPDTLPATVAPPPGQ